MNQPTGTRPDAPTPEEAAPGAPTPDEAEHRLGDQLLLVRACEGDEVAFEALVRRHSGDLLRLARGLLGDEAQAEDAVQEAFVSAWRKLPEFQRTAAFGTWMYRIVTNKCLNELRRRRPTQPLEAVAEPVASDLDSSPARSAERAASQQALAEALAGLTPEQRACWVLRELHHLSYDAIATAVGIGEPAVRGRIFRARRHLTEAMAPWR